MFVTSIQPVSILEQNRERLLESSKNNHNISQEIKELIQKIGKEPASEQTNMIINNLNEGFYAKKTLPLSFLTEHLKQAGLVGLAHEISQQRFKNPALNRSGECTEKDFRIYENLKQ